MRFARLMATKYFDPEQVARYGLNQMVGEIVVVNRYGRLYYMDGIPETIGCDGIDYNLLHN